MSVLHRIPDWRAVALKTVHVPFGPGILTLWCLSSGIYLLCIWCFLDLTWRDAVSTTVDVMTGGDLAAVEATLSSNAWIWTVTLLIHIVAWFYLPVVMALVLGELIPKGRANASKFELDQKTRILESQTDPPLNAERQQRFVDFVRDIKKKAEVNAHGLNSESDSGNRE